MSKIPENKKRKAAPGKKLVIDADTTQAYKDAFISTQDFFVAPGRKNHLLEHYMPGPGTVTAVIAPPGGGKTTLLTNLAFRYAFKLRYSQKKIGHDEFLTEYGDFLGLRMTQKPGPVLFIAREGHRQMQLLGAHQNELMAPASLADPDYFEPIVVMSDNHAPKLDIPESVKRLDAMIDTFIAVHGRAPGLIILDTARKLLAGDENSSSDVSHFMQTCQTMAKGCNAAVLIAHHTPKSGDTARGSGAWLADTDCEWTLKPGDKHVTINVTKLKGFKLPPPAYFTIKSVDTLLHDLDNPEKFLSAAHIEACAAPKKKVNESAVVGDAAAKNLLSSPEDKHAARQDERIKTMMAVWNETGEEYANELPYITRAALAEYLINTMGFTPKTAQQALKPSADAKNRASIIGPLLTDGLIAAYEHGWTIGAPEPAYPSVGQAQKPQKKKPFPRKG